MDGEVKVRRQRRRRRLEGRTSGGNEIQMTLENMEQTIKAHAVQSSGQLVRKDTFTVLKVNRGLDVPPEGGPQECKASDESLSGSKHSNNLTYSINKGSGESGTYNLEKLDTNENRPVPAPRKRIKNASEREKLSSDTDRDVTEIDLDDLRQKSPKSEINSATGSNISLPPVPKPRKIRTFRKDSETEKSDAEELKSPEKSLENSNTHAKQSESKELPLIENLLEETSELKKNSKKRKFGDLFQQNKEKRKTKTFGSMMRLEKKKIPRISAILKEIKENERVTKMEEEEDGKFDLSESPQYPEPVQNGQIYVQSKRGFYIMERDEAFKNGNEKMQNDEYGGKMEDSTVSTALLFQTYWSRSMIYFHGVLAGFALAHAATVTSIMMHYNYEPESFIGIYSCMSLKIHYAFYALIALCIVSCFDRLDVGHINKKHLQVAWKAPSMWMILCFYLVSFGLNFANHITEVRFDSLSRVNQTHSWWESDDHVGLLQWYHTVWARDFLLLIAWLLIAMTKFPDYLHAHVNNMVRFSEAKAGGGNFHRQKAERA